MTHNDYEEEERRNDWNVPIQITPLPVPSKYKRAWQELDKIVPTTTTSRNWRAKKIDDVTPLDFQPTQGSKSFYREIMEKGEINPYNGRYIIKYLGSDDEHPYIFAVYGALSDMLIPNSTIGFKGDVSKYDSDEPGQTMKIDRLYNGKWIPLLYAGNRIDQPSTEPSTEPSADGGRRRRRKTKRARRGRRRSSRKA